MSTEFKLPVLADDSQIDIQTKKQLASQIKLREARRQLIVEEPEATKAVVDPSETKPQRLTARQRAKHPKLVATEDILTIVVKSPWERLSSSEKYLLQPDHPSVEPFYAQLEEIRRIKAQFSLQASSSNAQVDPQARR